MTAAFGDQQALSNHGQITQGLKRGFINDSGSDRHTNDGIFTAGTGLVAAATGLAALAAIPGLEPEVDQGVELIIGNQQDITALTSVPAVRTTLGNILLPPERQCAIPALAGLDPDRSFVNELHELKKTPHAAGLSRAALRLLGCQGSRYRNNPTGEPAAYGKLDIAVGLCKQRVVATAAHVFAGVILGSTLANDDVASAYELAA